jgi:hypothetical protein
VGRHREDRDVLHHRESEVPHADLIDLLLDADEPTRKLLIFQLTQKYRRAEVEDLLLQVARLERAAGPRSELTQRRTVKSRARAAA